MVFQLWIMEKALEECSLHQQWWLGARLARSILASTLPTAQLCSLYHQFAFLSNRRGTGPTGGSVRQQRT